MIPSPSDASYLRLENLIECAETGTVVQRKPV